jgi:CheY-like chemotaxis protein
MAAEQEKCLQAGMNDVLMKPIEWERVRAVMRRYELRGGAASGDAAAGAAGDEEAAEDEAGGGGADGGEPAFAEATFLKIRDLIPAERLARYADALQADVTALAGASAEDGVQSVRGTAHKIVSQAGMLGLIRLSNLAAKVEEASDDPNELAEALQRFREAAGDVEERLRPMLRPGA